DEGISFADNDHRKGRLPASLIMSTKAALGPAWQLCAKYGINKTSLALSYILSYAEVSTVIPGIRTSAHVIQNTRLVQLEEADRSMIEQLGTTSLQPVMHQVQSLG
ncbi:MAG TPA: aldo/keto reductase, partial [Chitinophagaceae bacterium]|nr:aldo/keto reductase [Chitinophagaceae bacterium]